MHCRLGELVAGHPKGHFLNHLSDSLLFLLLPLLPGALWEEKWTLLVRHTTGTQQPSDIMPFGKIPRKTNKVHSPEVPALTLNQDTHRLCLLGASWVLDSALHSSVLSKTPHQRTGKILEKTRALFSVSIWCLTNSCNSTSEELDVKCPLLVSEEAVCMWPIYTCR